MPDILVDGVIDGRRAAGIVRDEVRGYAEEMFSMGVQPRVAFVRVGDDPASLTYVTAKAKACAQVGLRSDHIHLPTSTTEAELERVVQGLNADDDIDGVLLQLPLPASIPGRQILNAVAPEKDVDGFHPMNLGGVLSGRGPLEPCTPAGIIRLMELLGLDPVGMEALVVGRSVIVGRPMATMLLRANATVTCAHRHTRDLEALVRRSDLVVSATGVPRLIKGAWIKPGAWVFDVGQARLPDGQLSGDVEYGAALGRARGITPVPGGVGPMTIAQLLLNTIRAAQLRRGLLPYTIKRA